MGAYTCCIAGSKGGVGKTTIAINLAAVVSSHGYDVAIVDGDLQMANVGEMMGVAYEKGIHSVLADEVELEDVVIQDPASGIHLVPGDQELEAYTNADPENLPAVIGELESIFDIIFIDTSSGLSQEVLTAYGLADAVIVVSTADDCSYTDTNKTVDIVNRVGGDPIAGIINQAIGASVSDETSVFDIPLLGYIPQDDEATNDEPVVVNSPDSAISEEFISIADTLKQTIFEGRSLREIETVETTEHSSADEQDSDGEDDEKEVENTQSDDDDDDEDLGGSFKMFG